MRGRRAVASGVAGTLLAGLLAVTSRPDASTHVVQTVDGPTSDWTIRSWPPAGPGVPQPNFNTSSAATEAALGSPGSHPSPTTLPVTAHSRPDPTPST